jgi:hypothetical protein
VVFNHDWVKIVIEVDPGGIPRGECREEIKTKELFV